MALLNAVIGPTDLELWLVLKVQTPRKDARRLRSWLNMTGRTVPAAVAEKLYTATDLIAARGLEKTKIEDIAKASGVPKATLYYYFKGKDDILAFLFRDSLDALARDVASAADAPGPGRDRLASVIQVQVAHTMDRPATAQALVGDLSRAIRLPRARDGRARGFLRSHRTSAPGRGRRWLRCGASPRPAERGDHHLRRDHDDRGAAQRHQLREGR